MTTHPQPTDLREINPVSKTELLHELAYEGQKCVGNVSVRSVELLDAYTAGVQARAFERAAVICEDVGVNNKNTSMDDGKLLGFDTACRFLANAIRNAARGERDD